MLCHLTGAAHTRLAGTREGFDSLGVVLGCAHYPVVTRPLQEFPGTPVKNYCNLVAYYDRNVFRHSPAAQKSKIKVCAGLVSSGGSEEERTSPLPPSSLVGLPVTPGVPWLLGSLPPCPCHFLLSESPSIFSSCKDTSHWIESLP